MKKILQSIKKTIKHKDFKFILLIQVGLILVFVYFFAGLPKPVSSYELYNVRIYSPSIVLEKYDNKSTFNNSDSRVLKIIAGEYELIYHDVKGRNRFSDPPVIELLSNEEYLDAIYIITDDDYEIVELHGETRTYYTIEDHYSNDSTTIIVLIIFCALLEVGCIFVCAILIDEMLHGPRYHRPRKLFKKHPADKHVYDDGEENEFSPYKQKLLEKEREDEANDK